MQNKSFDLTGTKTEVARKGRNVGCNQAVSELTYRSAVLRYGARNVFQRSPKEKGAKITDTRIFFALMKQEGVLLPEGPTNQDQRDAAKLALICQRKALLDGRFKVNEAPKIQYNPAP